MSFGRTDSHRCASRKISVSLAFHHTRQRHGDAHLSQSERHYPDNNKLVTVYRYPFKVTHPGEGALYDKETEHVIEVHVSSTLESIWDYSADELRLVMFELGRQLVTKQLEDGELQEYQLLDLNTGNAPKERPFDAVGCSSSDGDRNVCLASGGMLTYNGE